MEWIKKDNVGWVDALRVVAIFAVVFSHCFDDFIAQFDADRSSFVTGVFMESIVRPCVVLMVMISGYLLLPIKSGYTLRGYYRKRIGRVFLPLVFWSLLLPVLSFFYFYYVSPQTHNPIIDVTTYTAATTLQKMATFLLNFNADTIPLWFLYMLIGLYLVLPIINAWLVQASKKDVQTFLWLWFASLFVPYLRVLGSLAGLGGEPGFAPLFGECDWNAFNSLYYVSGFIGYMVLAYYLKTYPLHWSWTKTLSVTVPMYLVGYAVTAFGYVFVQSLFPGTYKYLEIPWYMCGPNVLFQGLSVFILFMKLPIRSSSRLSKVASMMFGIYLCHFPFVQMTYDWFDIPSCPFVLRMFAMAITTFVLCYLLVRILYSISWLRRFVK